MVKPFCKYYFLSKRISSVDNPVIRELNRNVFSKISSVNDEDIQEIVSRLKRDKSCITISDFGAGSKKNKSNRRTISSIVKSAAVSPKFGKLMNLMVSFYNCKTIIELGTSLGVGASYLAMNNKSKIYTIEGSENISDVAQVNLKKATNVNFYIGEFSTKFQEVLADSGKPDLVYIDGNHTQQATVDYFNYFINKVNKKAILIFDDIHWSRGMELAWEEIISSSNARLTIDLFRMGIVFIDPDLKKEHFVLKF